MQEEQKYITFSTKKTLVTQLTKMSEQQINLHIIQIINQSIKDDHIAKWLIQKMKNQQFYSKYWYTLQKFYIPSKDKKHQKHMKQIHNAIQSFYQHGQNHNNINKQKEPLKKGQFGNNQDKRQFVRRIDELSKTIFITKSKQQKKNKFQKGLNALNQFIVQCKNKHDNDINQINKTEGNKQQHNHNNLAKYLTLNHNGKQHPINHILINNCHYYNPKNRSPILLDLEFSKFIYKNDDQLCHELISMNIMKYFNAIFKKEFIISYNIYPQQIGAFYQFVQNSQTISKIKKKYQTIHNYLKTQDKAQQNNIIKKFIQTYAGFCFIQFVLQLKDRNNENIMLKKDGSIFHIDTTFIFQSKPGGVHFQTAPFKMTEDYNKILGDFDSQNFKHFEILLQEIFTIFFLYKDEFFYKLQKLAQRKQLKCFEGFKIQKYKNKFCSNIKQVKSFVEDLIEESYDNWKTKKYDTYQFKTNGILQ